MRPHIQHRIFIVCVLLLVYTLHSSYVLSRMTICRPDLCRLHCAVHLFLDILLNTLQFSRIHTLRQQQLLHTLNRVTLLQQWDMLHMVISISNNAITTYYKVISVSRHKEWQREGGQYKQHVVSCSCRPCGKTKEKKNLVWGPACWTSTNKRGFWTWC